MKSVKANKYLRHLKKCFYRSDRDQTGYVIAWVLIFMLVAGLIISPFLMFMIDGLRVAYSRSDAMAEFYAADSGIEDAIYKIQAEYSATTPLDVDIGSGDGTIEVVTTDRFPDSGIIQIEAESIYYRGKTATEFTGCQRGYGATTATDHSEGTPVTSELPNTDLVGSSLQYGIDAINGKKVNITIENTWTLEGLESDAYGTMPHQELIVVGNALDKQTTALTAHIDDGDAVIPVTSTISFPKATSDDPSIIRIEDELISYTGITATEFTGCSRGINGTTAADHAQNIEVFSEEVQYKVDIAYDNSVGNLKIERVGAWLPGGFNYVTGSSNVSTDLENPVFDTATSIPAASTELFPDSGVIAIEHELIYYDSKDADTFQNCIRGYSGSKAADHLTVGTPISAEPEQAGFRGGTKLIWGFNNIDFEDLPRDTPLGGGEQPREEFPMRRTVTFSFSPAKPPTAIFSWIRTTRSDIYLAWHMDGGTYRITSTATDPDTGTQTTIESYVGRTLTGNEPAIFGDSRAIGNSLVKGDDPVRRDELLNESSAFIDAAHGNEIPDEAVVEAAYLYWTGWKNKGSSYDTEKLAKEVDQAVFNDTPIKADKVQIMQNVGASGNHGGWTFSSFKDVTSMLGPDSTAMITIMPPPEVPERLDIHWDNGNAEVRFRAPTSNPDDMTLDRAPFVVKNDDIWTSDIPITSSDSPLVLTSGNTLGTYEVTVKCTNGEVEIDGDGLEDGDSRNFTMVTASGGVPQATITKLTTTAFVNITNITPNKPADPNNNIDVDGNVITPGQTEQDIWLTSADPSDIISGASDDRYYQMVISCTEGMVVIDYGSSSIVLGEPGSRMTNGKYTLGLDPSEPFIIDENINDGGDLGDERSHAGWSIIVIYSHPDEPARRFFLYDEYTYVGNYGNNFPDGYLEFSITGFEAPEDFEGYLTYFVGEGDDHYAGDYVQLNGIYLSDAINPQNNPINSQSSVPGINTGQGEGVDIDTYDVASYINEGDSIATLKIDTKNDSWDIVFVFLSFKTIPSDDMTESPAAIITYQSSG